MGVPHTNKLEGLMKHTIFAAALALASISAAHADAINGLYNTGLGAEGTAEW